MVRVSDPTGTVSVRVPASWATTQLSDTSFGLWPAQPGLVRETVLSVGASFDEIAGLQGQRTFGENGIMILAQRYDRAIDQVDLLDTAVDGRFGECVFLDRTEIPLPGLNVADTDVISCVPEPGLDYGYFVFAATDDDDPTLAVTVVLSVVDRSETDIITPLPTTLIFDGDQLPAG